MAVACDDAAAFSLFFPYVINLNIYPAWVVRFVQNHRQVFLGCLSALRPSLVIHAL